MSKENTRFGRCDFCPKRAVVQFSRVGRLVTRRNPIRVHYRSCAEHESSPSWQAIMALYADAAFKRAQPTTRDSH